MSGSRYRVLISDGGRHRAPTGYGKNARTIALGLARHPEFEVAFTRTDRPFEVEEELALPLRAIPVAAGTSGFDCVIQVGQPSICRNFNIPSLLFTNLDVSDLPRDQREAMSLADAILAPNKRNFAVFSKYFRRVYLTQQGIPEGFFKPKPKWREEGVGACSFIFVGTYSFRKGVDILLEAFVREFVSAEAHLHIHVPGEQADRAANGIISEFVATGRVANISLSTKSLTEAWMARRYNAHDCFVTATRGEGWGLPIVEAMLCGLPVIAPLGSGMEDYLLPDMCIGLGVQQKKVADIRTKFGESFKKVYGQPGICYEEVGVDQLRRALRWVHDNRDKAAIVGKKGRDHMLKNHSEERFVSEVAAAVKDLLKSSVVPIDQNKICLQNI